MKPIFIKLIASAAVGVGSFLLLRFGLKSLLSLDLMDALLALGAAGLAWQKVAVWEWQKLADNAKNVVK